MTNPTESLVARLRRRADTMNGTQPVGASDGCGTMTLGYYSGGGRDLDREAAERLSTLEAALAGIQARIKPQIIAALREWAEFEQDGGNVEQGAAIDAILDWYDAASANRNGARGQGPRAQDIETAERISILEAALRPFAEFVPDFFDDGYQDDDIVKVESHHGGLDLTLTVADFRRARNIIGEA